MKKLLINFLILFFCVAAYAQKIDITWGDVNDKDAAVIINILGKSSDGDIYALSLRRKTYYLETYKSNMDRKSMTKIELPEISGKDVSLEKVFLMNNKLVLFASSTEGKSNTLYAYNLSTKGKVSKRTKILDIPIEKKRRSGNIHFHQEKNDPNLLVGMFVPRKKEQKQVAEFKLLSSDLSILSDVKKEFPFKDDEKDRIAFKNAKYDKDGNVYILTNSKEKIGKVVTLEYKLSQLLKGGGDKELLLGDGDNAVENVDYILDSDGELKVFGFFYKKRGIVTKTRAKGIDGAFIQFVNASSFETTYDKIIDFTYKHKKKFMKDKRAKADKLMPFDFVPRYYYDNPDGFTIVAERRLRTVSRDSKGRTTVSYFYQDIMILKVNDDGEISFIQDVDKRQYYGYTQMGMNFGVFSLSGGGPAPHVTNLPYMSFMPIVGKDGQLIFIYNDNPKNVGIETEKRKILRNMRKGLPMVATVDKDGKKKVDMIPGAKDDETIFRTTINLQISENEYIIYGSKRRKDKLGKITISY